MTDTPQRPTIDEIRAVHAAAEGPADAYDYVTTLAAQLLAAHEHRGILLAEVDRLRAENERMRRPLPQRAVHLTQQERPAPTLCSRCGTLFRPGERHGCVRQT